MTSKQYISEVQDISIDAESVKYVENLYGIIKSDFVKKILSRIAKVNSTEFLDNDYRVLDYDEIINANEDLHVDFSGKGLLPLFDCSDNDFIVYNVHSDKWYKFNIVDEIEFKDSSKLEELL